MPVERVCLSAMSEHRRASKPIMEKRRRARINCSLQELKSLILDATRKDSSRHSKLEKADILEMTVKHLQAVQRQQMAAAVASDPTVLHKFKSGFAECTAEIARYLNSVDGVDKSVRQRILQHMGTCLTGLNNYLSPLAFPAMTNGYPPNYYQNPPMIVKDTMRAVPGGMMMNRVPSHIPQHFFPASGLSMDYESGCRSPSSPHSVNSSYGPSTPTTPNSPSSICSKMSDSDPVWRPW